MKKEVDCIDERTSFASDEITVPSAPTNAADAGAPTRNATHHAGSAPKLAACGASTSTSPSSAAPVPTKTTCSTIGMAIAPASFPTSSVRRVIGAAVRLAYRIGFRAPHWRVGWRALDEAGDTGALSTGRLSGAGWANVADDGSRFYADPFPFEHGGQT